MTVLTLAVTMAGIMVAAGLLIKRDTDRSREQIHKWTQGYSPGYTEPVSGKDALTEGLLAASEDGNLAGGGAGALSAAFTGPVVLSWTRIGFSVPTPGGGPGRRRILRGVSAVAGMVPADGSDEDSGGCLTAIIGPSGDHAQDCDCSCGHHAGVTAPKARSSHQHLGDVTDIVTFWCFDEMAAHDT